MLKRLKSVSMLLFLMGASTGAAYAVANPGVTDVKITQQTGTCKGVVVDATGETVIGASVVVKGTTNGTITGIDGDFSLSGVKQGDVIQVSFVGYLTQEIKFKGESLWKKKNNYYLRCPVKKYLNKLSLSTTGYIYCAAMAAVMLQLLLDKQA